MRTLRALIMSENMPCPPDRRVLAEATSLADHGWSVSVICPAGPGQPLREELDGVRFFRYPQPPGGDGLLGYALEYGISLFQALRLALNVAIYPGFDVIQGCNPPDLFFLIGGLFRLFGKSYIFDQHDLSPEVYSSRFSNARPAVHRLLLALERLSYRTASAVLATNESYRRIAIERGKIAPEKVFVVRNGPREGWPSYARPDVALKRGKRHMVLYSGVMGPQDGVQDFLQAAVQILSSRDDVSFVLLGDGDERLALEAAAFHLGISDQVHFAGWVSDEHEMSAYLATADVCVSPEPPSPLNDVSTFVKVAEYLAAGKPVVAYDLPETRFTAADAGLYAVPGDWRGLAAQVERILDDAALTARMHQAAARRLPALVWERQVPALVQAYRYATAGRSAALEPASRSVFSGEESESVD